MLVHFCYYIWLSHTFFIWHNSCKSFFSVICISLGFMLLLLFIVFAIGCGRSWRFGISQEYTFCQLTVYYILWVIASWCLITFLQDRFNSFKLVAVHVFIYMSFITVTVLYDLRVSQHQVHSPFCIKSLWDLM